MDSNINLYGLPRLRNIIVPGSELHTRDMECACTTESTARARKQVAVFFEHQWEDLEAATNVRIKSAYSTGGCIVKWHQPKPLNSWLGLVPEFRLQIRDSEDRFDVTEVDIIIKQEILPALPANIA